MTKPNGRTIRNVAAGTAAVAALALVAARGIQVPAPAHLAIGPDRVARGEYLVTVAGCNDCHTPWKMGENGPEPDMTRMLSGHPADLEMPPAPPSDSSPWMVSMAATSTAFAGPWGVSFTANLTPCEETGLGPWTEEIFINTMRTGRHWGQSRPLLPPMPWFNYARMSDEDLGSVFAYLRSIPPHRNPVPPPIPPGGPELEEDPWN